tara:strand:- start:992 stop:2173 length:1182 start_codon:yes stop_codon:yes gene_type:complete
MKRYNKIKLIEDFCLSENLATYDPYDVWMGSLGIQVKQLYNKNKTLGILPAAVLTLWDTFLNNKHRISYKKKEYPTVRALAAITLLKQYNTIKKKEYLESAERHIEWLLLNSSKGYIGLGWGLGFNWAADDGLDYDSNTPFSTHTPYCLEAIDLYIQVTGNSNYVSHVENIFEFFENDIQVMFEDETSMATSYGPQKDRLVTNSVSYALFAYSIFLKYLPGKESLLKFKIKKLYNFIASKQLNDGSWLYEPDNSSSFIDCFHSCFILKNVFKANEIIRLKGSEKIILLGYDYLKNNFYNTKHGLFKRFTLSNKPSLVKFDLYDNSEMLGISLLLKDEELSNNLNSAIRRKFILNNNIYSIIDLFNIRRNINMLRWAVMPYLHALASDKNDILD